MPIHYVKGDATQPIGTGRKTIAHIVNDCGRWGAGFTRALTEKWPATEIKYYQWAQRSPTFELGKNYIYSLKHLNTFITPDPDSHVDDAEALFLCNMCAQHGVGRANKPIRYNALEMCLRDLGIFAEAARTSVHTIRLGCGLAGGSWDRVEPILARELAGIDVYVYDL